MDIFVQRMRSAMFLKGIRQADLAKATGFSDGQVSSWFNGKYRPNAEKISLIAKALGVSVDYLLGKEEFKYSDLLPAPVMVLLSARFMHKRKSRVNRPFLAYLRGFLLLPYLFHFRKYAGQKRTFFDIL